MGFVTSGWSEYTGIPSPLISMAVFGLAISSRGTLITLLSRVVCDSHIGTIVIGLEVSASSRLTSAV